MKVSMLLFSGIAALLMTGAGQAQTAPASTWTALPPPSIDDPGSQPVPASSAPEADDGGDAMSVPVPALPGGEGADARGEPAPTVKATTHDGKLIEEYYRGGNLYMVRVHPKHGVSYTYMVDENRKLNRAAGAPPVDPVLYKVLEWGQPKGKRGSDED